MKNLIVFLHTLKIKLQNFFFPEPELEEDYSDKVVRLLRRDFDVQNQNKILISISKKLAELRLKDMKKMEEDYKVLKESYVHLNSRIAIQ
jgi:hypothetical protein